MATRFHNNRSQKEEEKEEKKKKAAAPPSSKMEVGPDLDDLMDNWFFGGLVAVERAKKEEEKVHVQVKKEEEEEQQQQQKTTSRLTQEWLEEAKRLVENSVSRPGTPSRLGLAGTSPSPRFASRAGDGDSPSPLQRRDPRSRSARRHRFPEGISTEILQKSSARFSDASLPSSPSRHSSPNRTATNQWLSSSPSALPEPPRPATPPPLPPKQRLPRPSRFLKEPPPPLPPRAQDPALSPPRNLVESAHRRSVSASTCSIESAFLPRRSVDSSAFHPRRSIDNAHLQRRALSASVEAEEVDEDIRRINASLKRKKATMEAISSGELVAMVKVVLSGTSTSNASSMVAAICYAWLLENKGDDTVVVPVMNMRRVRMWKHKQVAWLFQHLGIDASSLLFADEVDLEGLIMARQSSIIVIGQDVLKTNGEAPNLKKFLLAGILLDTQNLNSSAKFFTNRDAEAVQLLLVGSSPNYRQELFEQLMRDHRSSPFIEAMKANYGEPPCEDASKNGGGKEHRPSKTKSPSISSEEARTPAKDKLASTATPASAKTPSPAPSKASETPSRGKNRFSFAKFFGFGSK